MVTLRGAGLLLSIFTAFSCSLHADAQSFSQSTNSSGLMQGLKDVFSDPSIRGLVGSAIKQTIQNKLAPRNPAASPNPYSSAYQGYGSNMALPPAMPADNSAAYGGYGSGSYGNASTSFDNSASNAPSDSPFVFSSKIRPQELAKLGRYEIAVLIDSSGSMSTEDCPSAFSMGASESRWQWCREQMGWLAQQINSAFPQGVSVLPYASKFQELDHVSASQMGNVFNTFSPDGGTNLHLPLKAELDSYFAKKNAGMQPKPLMLAVITDGDPSNKGEVKRIIKDAASKISYPDEIKIVFFMIGNDTSGQNFVDELDNRLPQQTNVDIVSSHSFAEVQQFGLARSLAMGLR